MNRFIKDQGMLIITAEELESKRLQQYWEDFLISRNQLNKTLKNDGAYLETNSGRFVNIAYNFSAPDMLSISRFALEMLTEISEEIPKDHEISFRLPLTISKLNEQNPIDNRLKCVCRLAFVPKGAK